MRLLVLACGLTAALPLRADAVRWASPLLGRTLDLELLEPTTPPRESTASSSHGRNVPAVFYFTGLDLPRVGTEPDATILRDLRAAGYLVVVFDYAHDPRARLPELAREFVALRHALRQHVLVADRGLDLDHVYFVPAGDRLQRDVPYDRVAGEVRGMDIVYPAKPAQPSGAVLEFSCDNRDRMGNSSLDFCTDALLPCAAAAGFAVAMADHPVGPPYHGIDPMPDSARKIKAAVRTLRAQSAALHLNGRIVAAGFSRGSGMALMLATTIGHHEFEGFGEHPDVDSTVQGAVVMSGRFTYLDLLPQDKMIARYTRAWGDFATHRQRWREQGALDYLTKPTVPLFLTINGGESPDAIHQMDVLRHRLDELGSPFTYAPEPGARGHHMPLDPAVLTPLLDYLQRALQ